MTAYKDAISRYKIKFPPVSCPIIDDVIGLAKSRIGHQIDELFIAEISEKMEKLRLINSEFRMELMFVSELLIEKEVRGCS